MTEVVGYILTFGLLSIVLVLAMLAFNVARDNAAEEAARLQAESTAHQVASIGVEAALFAEQREGEPTYARHLILPRVFEGHGYEITLEYAETGLQPDRVLVHVPVIGHTSAAPLFSVSAASSIDVCGHTVAGGPITVRYGPNDEGYPTGPGGPASSCLYLEATP